MNKEKASLRSGRNVGIFLIWLSFMGFYISGLFFPDTWWATHFVGFIPPVWKWILLLASFSIPVLLFISEFFGWKSIRQNNKNPRVSHFIIIGITIIMGFLFVEFPIVHDRYGEAYKLQSFLDKTASTIPQQSLDEFFKYSLSPWAGQYTVMSLVTFVSHYAQINYKSAFIILDLFFGLLFVLCWLYFIRDYLKNRNWKIIASLAGLSAPFLLNFYGHIEINAPALFANLFWLTLLLRYLKNKSPKLLWGLLIMLFVCIKFHAVALLFIPAFMLVFTNHYLPAYAEEMKIISWKKGSLLILALIFFIGMIAYFFVFKDHIDPRQLQDTAMEYDRLFLPLLSPDPPLEKYNMLGFNHIFDYFSEMLLWSPVFFFLLISILLFFRKKINWNKPELVLTGLTLILFGSLFFVVNPLLSMQMDWDLFAMPAPAFLVFGIVMIRQVEKEKINPILAGGSLSLTLMCIPFFMVHASANTHSKHLESAGIRIFKTYYEWTDQTIQIALDIADQDMTTKRERKRNIIKKLKPYAIPGKDVEYALILVSEGEQVLRDDKDPIKALQVFDEVSYYYPNLENNILYQLEAYFVLGQMDKAYEKSIHLIELKHPDERTAIRIAIHSALEAEYYEKAFLHAGDYIDKWGSEDIIGEVYYRLQQDDKVEEIKFLFNRGD